MLHQKANIPTMLNLLRYEISFLPATVQINESIAGGIAPLYVMRDGSNAILHKIANTSMGGNACFHSKEEKSTLGMK